MADDEHLQILKEGTEVWNKRRNAHPDLWPDLSDAHLGRADLTGANLTNARLPGADLTGADLTNADLTNAGLTNADLTGADLPGADLTAAKLRNAVFEDTLVVSKSQGLDGLTEHQKAGLIYVEEDPDAVEQSDAPGRAAQITVGSVKSIVGPAHWVLQSLSIPNDFKEEHRDLFVGLVGSVAELHQKLAAIEEENRRLADENQDLRNSIDQALPLWKRAFDEFVLKSAGGLGDLAANGTAFAAGFIAGTLYNTLSPGDSGINI